MGFFDGFLGDIVGSVAAPIVGGLFGKEGQEDANAQNIKLSREQMDFQERMSNTAHQREVKDLQAAGLNPMLSVNHAGSSTPVGSLARVENTNDAAIRGASSALSAQLIKSQIANQDSQTAVNEATADKVKTDARISLATALQGEYEVRKNTLRESNDQFGEWIASQMRADISSNLTRNLSSFIERETFNDLIEYGAGTKPYNKLNVQARKFASQLGISEQDFKNLVLDYTLSSFEVPKASALSEFYKSPFGREVAPYLNSANDMVNLGAGAIGTGIKLFRKPPVPITEHHRYGTTITNIMKGD